MPPTWYATASTRPRWSSFRESKPASRTSPATRRCSEQAIVTSSSTHATRRRQEDTSSLDVHAGDERIFFVVDDDGGGQSRNSSPNARPSRSSARSERKAVPGSGSRIAREIVKHHGGRAHGGAPHERPGHEGRHRRRDLTSSGRIPNRARRNSDCTRLAMRPAPRNPAGAQCAWHRAPMSRPVSGRLAGTLVGVLVLIATPARAEAVSPETFDEAPRAMTLEQAIEHARTNHPRLAAARLRLAATRRDAEVPGGQWLPRVGGFAQIVGATTNNSTATQNRCPDRGHPARRRDGDRGHPRFNPHPTRRWSPSARASSSTTWAASPRRAPRRRLPRRSSRAGQPAQRSTSTSSSSRLTTRSSPPRRSRRHRGARTSTPSRMRICEGERASRSPAADASRRAPKPTWRATRPA